MVIVEKLGINPCLYLSHAKRALPFVLHPQDNNVPALPQYKFWWSWFRAHILIFLQLISTILTRNKHHTRSINHWPHVYETLANNILWWPYYHELNVILHITAWNYTLINQHVSTQTQASQPLKYIWLRRLSYVPLRSTKVVHAHRLNIEFMATNVLVQHAKKGMHSETSPTQPTASGLFCSPSWQRVVGSENKVQKN